MEAKQRTPYSKAVQVEATSSHTYSINFAQDWRIGTVPNGGYVTSCLLAAVSLHFSTTLKAQDQPHSMAVQLQFLRRTEMGPGRVTIKDVKLGRQTSVVHVTLDQDGREEVVGYITQSNIPKEQGPTLQTNWELHPPLKQIDFSKLKDNTEPNWYRIGKLPFEKFRSATTHLEYWIPKKEFAHNSIVDEWIRFRSGEKFTNTSLGFVVDMFPLIMENYQGRSPQETLGKKDTGNEPLSSAKFWYPTVFLNMEVKKVLPDEGAEWLFVRVRSKQIKNGRLDYEIVVLDENNELVCTSQHANFIVDSSRNTSERRKNTEKL